MIAWVYLKDEDILFWDKKAQLSELLNKKFYKEIDKLYPNYKVNIKEVIRTSYIPYNSYELEFGIEYEISEQFEWDFKRLNKEV